MNEEFECSGVKPDVRGINACVGGVTESYKSLRLVKNEPITRHHTIELPVQVQTHVHFAHTAETHSSGSVLHVRLNGLLNTYASGGKKRGRISKVAF